MATCRFCLEDGSTRENPLLQPCACRGSGGFVHWRCLRQWAMADPERNGQDCPVCKTEYTVNILPRFEELRPARSAALVVMENIATLGSVLQAFFFVVMLQQFSYMPIQHNIYGALCLAHAVLQPLFILAAYNLWRVKNFGLYWRISLRNGIQPLLLLFHAFLYYNLIVRQDILFGSTLLVVMNCHWAQHLRVLRTINARLLAE
jgi:hypothetical protein